MTENRQLKVDFDGDAYRKASSHQKDWGLKLIEELALKGDERVLDLGCGDGRLTACLAECVPAGRVLGIDSSPGMLATASKLQRPSLQFRLLDINNMDFHEEYDVIFSNATLHWVKDHKRLLGAVYRALAAGGVARFNFAGDGNCATFNRIARHVMSQPQFAEHFLKFQWPWYMPSTEAYAQVVRKSPFGDTRIWAENANRVFADKEALVGWIDQPSLVPFMQVLPESVRESFRSCIVDRMLEETKHFSGGFLEYFQRLNFMGRKLE